MDPVEAARRIGAHIEDMKRRLPDEVFNPLLAEMGFPELRYEFEALTFRAKKEIEVPEGESPLQNFFPRAPKGPVTVTYTPYDPEREAFLDRVGELYRERGPADTPD